MNNSPSNLNSIRQPAPNISNGNGANEATKKRTFNVPYVGALEIPTISSTPLADTIALKKQENPRTAYKLTPKSQKGFKLRNLFSLAITGCSIGALLTVIDGKRIGKNIFSFLKAIASFPKFMEKAIDKCFKA